jgi:phosphate transport system permease protein
MSGFAYRRRKTASTVMLGLCAASALMAVGVLALILGFVLVNGIHSLNLDFFTHMPTPLGEPGGGVANSIVGSLLLIGVAALIGIPAGVGAGVFLSEYAGARLANVIRFTADVLTGVPSIVVGVFVYTLIVLKMGHFSALAGGVALAIIMLPIVARSSEEMLKLVPRSQREAALALGITRWRTILSVIIPAARRGLVTGGLLAVARAGGETAPLIFTVLGNRLWSLSVTGGPIDALPLRIWRYGTGPYDAWHQQAWAASFVLVMVVFVISLAARLLLTRRG